MHVPVHGMYISEICEAQKVMHANTVSMYTDPKEDIWGTLSSWRDLYFKSKDQSSSAKVAHTKLGTVTTIRAYGVHVLMADAGRRFK
jgi:hypothetical protein